MANTRKTYGVNGLLEWDTTIPVGKATMKVHFSGGSLTGYGVTPATFTTEDPMKQMIIEKSDYFKSGKIFVVREMEGSGKYQLPEKKAQQSNHMPGQAATASAVMDSALNPDGKAAGGPTAEPLETVAGKPSGEALGTGAEPSANAQGTVTVVEVTDIDEAREYLVEKFGIARSTIRYKSNVLKEAEERNIQFVLLDE